MSALEPDDPRSVGEYRLLGRLGAGGMGRVFLGRSPGGRLVAVKAVRRHAKGMHPLVLDGDGDYGPCATGGWARLV